MDNLQVAELCFEAAIKCMSPDSFDSTIAIDLSDKSEYILNRALAQVLSLKGAALNHSGRYEEAIINCSKVIELDPKCAAVFNNRGAALNCLGRYEEAAGDFYGRPHDRLHRRFGLARASDSRNEPRSGQFQLRTGDPDRPKDRQ